MAALNFDELFVEEIPEWTDVEGNLIDGYTVIKAVGPLTVPNLKKRIVDRIDYLQDLLNLEEAGDKPAGIGVARDSRFPGASEAAGIFNAALLLTLGTLISRGGQEYADAWGRTSVGRVQFTLGLGHGPNGPETHITIFAGKTEARELVESGNLNLEKLELELSTGNDVPWPTDGILEVFRDAVGGLVLEAATESIQLNPQEPRPES